MFRSEGTFDVTVKDAYLSEPKFNKQTAQFDVCLLVETDDGQSDHWNGEWSDVLGTGNYANIPQWQSTMETLNKIGWSGDAQALFSQAVPDDNGRVTLPFLIGLKTTATTKASDPEKSKTGKIYYNVQYLGGGGAAPKALNFQAFQQMMGVTTQQQNQQQQVQQQVQQTQQTTQPQGNGVSGTNVQGNPFSRIPQQG